MKGYAVLAVMVSLIVLSFPPLMLRQSSQQSSDTVKETDVIAVKHTEKDASSEISFMDMTVYETAAQIAWDAPIEAIKAQAVSCYTLLCYQTLDDGCVESTCLSYPDSYTEDYWKRTLGEHYEQAMTAYREAVQAVFGKQLVYDGQPIMALSHFLNGGVTENGSVLLGVELPYLQSVASPADAASPEQLQSISFSLAEAKERLALLLGAPPSEEAVSWFVEPQKTEAGTVKHIQVCGQAFSGKQLQETFGLPSASFEVTVQGEQVTFNVHGKGHFVGLSTYGAIAMAKDGQAYEQIVCHYYTGATIA